MTEVIPLVRARRRQRSSGGLTVMMVKSFASIATTKEAAKLFNISFHVGDDEHDGISFSGKRKHSKITLKIMQWAYAGITGNAFLSIGLISEAIVIVLIILKITKDSKSNFLNKFKECLLY